MMLQAAPGFGMGGQFNPAQGAGAPYQYQPPQQMMQWAGGANPNLMWVGGILWLVTWVLVIVLLVSVIRLLWKKGDKLK